MRALGVLSRQTAAQVRATKALRPRGLVSAYALAPVSATGALSSLHEVAAGTACGAGIGLGTHNSGFHTTAPRCLDDSVAAKALATAKASIDWDPNPKTRAATAELVEAAARGDAGVVDELVKAFGDRLSFGTAGLRGVMGPGTYRMNDLTVIQAAQGVCAYLLETFGDAAKDRGVAVGYDHRGREDLDISSRNFALLTAAAFLSKGFKVYLYGSKVATPLIPFSVEKHGCAAGVMVTASHNPKDDNGFKVYWGSGSQIVPPHDSGIAAQIEANVEPWEAYDVEAVRGHERCIDPGVDGDGSLGREYIATVAGRLCRHPEENAAGGVTFAYTAMHGVGHPWVKKAFEAFNLPPFVSVEAQQEPDPTFPTVTLPNPEEGKGALSLAMQTADEAGATVILASDPDADRLAVAEKQRSGEWQLLTGNDIGVLLGHWQWTKFVEEQSALPASERTNPGDVYMLAPAVASKMLGAIAAKEGFNFEETLTGFKWAGTRTDALRAEGKTVLFAYEPEIGFCVGDVVKDKDGICAAAVFAEMTLHTSRRGKLLTEHLHDLREAYGHFIANNGYLFSHDKGTTNAIFDRLRNDGHYWLRCGRWVVSGVRDLTVGVETATPDGKPYLPVSPSSHYLTYNFANGATVTLRTSGTEPKLKYYSELHGSDPDATRAELGDLVQTMIAEMLQPEDNGLEYPKEE